MRVDTGSSEPQTDLVAEEGAAIRRVRLGERDAYRSLVERYQGRVYALCVRIIGDRHEAEDACQETFVRAYRALDGFDVRYPFVNWLLRIATNTSRNYVARRRRTVPLPNGGIAAPAERAASEAAENCAALRGAVNAALAGLSEAKRTALLLFHQSRRSYADIAEIMDMPIGTVKTAIHRARAEIRRALGAQGLL
jgi:RNA polymerase sigma-70 factor (ECF subfamily)